MWHNVCHLFFCFPKSIPKVFQSPKLSSKLFQSNIKWTWNGGELKVSINLRTTTATFTNCFTQNKCTYAMWKYYKWMFYLKVVYSLLLLCTINNDLLNIMMLFLAMNQVIGMNELFLVKNSRTCDTFASCWPLMSQPTGHSDDKRVVFSDWGLFMW